MQHVDATPTVSGAPPGDRHDRSAAVRRWGPVAVAAVAWAVAYRVNAPLWHWVVGDAAGLDLSSRLGSSVHFFFYDVTKISLLLSGVIFVVTVLRTFMSSSGRGPSWAVDGGEPVTSVPPGSAW